jgi:hypothetical protein
MASRTPVPMTLAGAPLLACTIPPLPGLVERGMSHRTIPKGMISELFYVYAIRRRDTREIKIGVATDPYRRISGLQCAHGEPLELSLVLPCHGHMGLPIREREIHQRFAPWRKQREWFEECDEILAWMESESAMIPSTPDIAPLLVPLLSPKCHVVLPSRAACGVVAEYASDCPDGTRRWMCRKHGNGGETPTCRSLEDLLIGGLAL